MDILLTLWIGKTIPNNFLNLSSSWFCINISMAISPNFVIVELMRSLYGKLVCLDMDWRKNWKFFKACSRVQVVWVSLCVFQYFVYFLLKAYSGNFCHFETYYTKNWEMLFRLSERRSILCCVFLGQLPKSTNHLCRKSNKQKQAIFCMYTQASNCLETLKTSTHMWLV